jgi:hypothetical protein
MGKSYRYSPESTEARRALYDFKREQFEARTMARATSPRVLARREAFGEDRRD